MFLQARFNHAPERRHEKSTGLHLNRLAGLVKSYLAILIWRRRNVTDLPALLDRSGAGL